MALIFFGILLSLAWCNCGLPTPTLMIHPKKPLVERGGSIQLTCSMDCPGGKVQWEGLDTDLGNIVSNDTHSILTVAKATTSMEGVKFCTGKCENSSYQNKVALQVYSFPDTLQLESQPQIPTASQTARLFCSMSHVYPPGALTLSWFREAEKLDAALEEEEMGDSQEQLFLYHSILEVPTIVENTVYRCRVTLEVGQKIFSREKVVNISLQATQGAPNTTEDTTSTLKTVRTTYVAPPELSTTTGGTSFAAATSSLPPLHFAKPHASAAPTVRSKALPRLESEAKTDSPGSTLALLHVRETSAKLGVTSADWPFTLRPASNDDSPFPTVATEKLHHFTTPKEDLCRPMITLIPPQGTTGGALRISCQVPECRDSIRIQWVETPVSRAQYQVEEAMGQSTLLVESVSLEHQGVYRCVTMTSKPQMASVRVVVSEANFSTLITIGTAGSLLGLVITGYMSHHLRRRRGG